MFYIYAKSPSTSAQELAGLLGGRRVRRFDGFDFFDKNKPVKFDKSDVLVCWGTSVGDLDDVQVLNHSKRSDRYYDLRTLNLAGINTVRLHGDLYSDYKIPRLTGATGGSDMLNPPAKGDYYMRKENFKAVYRVHSFAGKSIRAGIKEMRTGFQACPPDVEWRPGTSWAHPWVWTWDGGWRVRYDGFQSDKAVRMYAHKAVKILGLTFAAVDIGMVVSDSGPKFIIIEVNRFPHVEGTTLDLYAKNIQKWAMAPVEPEKAKETEDEGSDEIRIPPPPTFTYRSRFSGLIAEEPLAPAPTRPRRSLNRILANDIPAPPPTGSAQQLENTYQAYVRMQREAQAGMQVNMTAQPVPQPTTNWDVETPFFGDDDDE